MKLIFRWLIASACGYVLSRYAPLGVHFDGVGTALWVMLLMGLLSATVGLIFKVVLSVALFAIPIIGWVALLFVDALVTAGLFAVVARFTTGFRLDGGFMSAFIFGLLVSLITGLFMRVVEGEERKESRDR